MAMKQSLPERRISHSLAVETCEAYMVVRKSQLFIKVFLYRSQWKLQLRLSHLHLAHYHGVTLARSNVIDITL